MWFFPGKCLFLLKGCLVPRKRWRGCQYLAPGCKCDECGQLSAVVLCAWFDCVPEPKGPEFEIELSVAGSTKDGF
jgi:hypothetical protein